MKRSVATIAAAALVLVGLVSVAPAAAGAEDLTPIRTIIDNSGLGSPSGVARDSDGNLYVANNNFSSVTVYASGASGDAAPIRTIAGPATGLQGPLALALDSTGNLYVANAAKDSDVNTVTVYGPGANGNVAPVRSISGSDTGLAQPSGLAVDASGDLFVTNADAGPNPGDGSVTVYASGVSGNVAPIRSIKGNLTQLSEPRGLAFDSHGDLYVTSRDSVLSFAHSADGNVPPAGSISGLNTQLSGPFGLTFDPADRLFVSSLNADRLTVYTPGASGDVAPVRTLSGSDTGLSNPWGLALDGSGNLIVASFGGDSVETFGPLQDGNVAPTRKIVGVTGLSAPGAVARDSAGNVFVANRNTSSVTVYGPATTGAVTPIRRIAGANTRLDKPFGLALDSAGRVYVANGGDRSVTVYANGADGNAAPVRRIAGTNTNFNEPSGVAIDPSTGDLFVGDFKGAAVRVFAPDADGDVAPIRNIEGVNTGLTSPAGLAFDSARKLYVANVQSMGVSVFEPDATGDVAPIRTIQGVSTGLLGPAGLAFDPSGNLYVGNFMESSLVAFAPGAGGNVAPTRTITGSSTRLATPIGLTFDSVGVLYVANSSGNSVTEYSTSFPPSPSLSPSPSPSLSRTAQTITFPTPADTRVDKGPVRLTATASSGLPVSYALGRRAVGARASAACALGGGTVTLVAKGACTITASQSGDTNYAPAEEVQRTFTVTKAPLPIAVTLKHQAKKIPGHGKTRLFKRVKVDKRHATTKVKVSLKKGKWNPSAKVRVKGARLKKSKHDTVYKGKITKKKVGPLTVKSLRSRRGKLVISARLYSSPKPRWSNSYASSRWVHKWKAKGVPKS